VRPAAPAPLPYTARANGSDDAPSPRRAASLGLPVAASPTPAPFATATPAPFAIATPAPVASATPAPFASATPAPLDTSVAQAAYTNAPPEPPPYIRAQAPDPISGPTLVPPPNYGAAPPYGPPPPPPPGGGFPLGNEELYNRGVVTDPPGGPARGGLFSSTGTGSNNFNFNASECLGTFTSQNRCLFQSDHCFDGFISPITNPFLFEDPRALTEVRPIFIQQGAPSNNWVFHGGNIQWFGVQARVAVTERISFVMNKFGGIWDEPNNPPPGFGNGSSFSEIWFGPKYTFLRNEKTGTLGAVGWTFQIPVGSGSVSQNTGNLSNTPYISMAQNFGRSTFGSFNTMGTFGYTFDGQDNRSDYLFLSGHLDYDILEMHKYYPVLEMHFFDYTEAGKTTTLGFEGRDLINYGSQAVSGRKYMTIAPGFRWVFWKGQNNASAQTGFGVELPIVGTRDLLDYRLTWDMILRY
jgi:hypothetical protein